MLAATKLPPQPSGRVTKAPQKESEKLKRLSEAIERLSREGRYISKSDLAKQIDVTTQWLSTSPEAVSIYGRYMDEPRLKRLEEAIAGLVENDRLIEKAALAQMAGVGIAWLSSSKAAIRAYNNYRATVQANRGELNGGQICSSVEQISEPEPTPEPEPETAPAAEVIPELEPETETAPETAPEPPGILAQTLTLLDRANEEIEVLRRAAADNERKLDTPAWLRQELKTARDQLESAQSLLSCKEQVAARLQAENEQLKAKLAKLNQELTQTKDQLTEEVARSVRLDVTALATKIQDYLETTKAKAIAAEQLLAALEVINGDF